LAWLCWEARSNPSLPHANSPKTYLHTTSVFDTGVTGEVITGVTAGQIAKKERHPQPDE